MKKTLTAIAFLGALATTSVVSANPHAAHNEGLQNYYFYFGAPCCDRPLAAAAAPCGAVAATPCAQNCDCPCGVAPVEYEQVCSTCSPCGSTGGIFNLFGILG